VKEQHDETDHRRSPARTLLLYLAAIDAAVQVARLLQNAPIECDKSLLAKMFQGAVRYW
jgi:hypothetical protein